MFLIVANVGIPWIQQPLYPSAKKYRATAGTIVALDV